MVREDSAFNNRKVDRGRVGSLDGEEHRAHVSASRTERTSDRWVGRAEQRDHTMTGGSQHKARDMFQLAPGEKWSSWQRKHRLAWNIVRARSPGGTSVCDYE